MKKVLNSLNNKILLLRYKLNNGNSFTNLQLIRKFFWVVNQLFQRNELSKNKSEMGRERERMLIVFGNIISFFSDCLVMF